MGLSVVLPCRDEADTVTRCVREAHEVLAEAGVHGEVVVVDNGSRDGSSRRAAAAGARVVLEQSRGYGNAVLRGVRAAGFGLVGVADCDGSYDFGDFSAMLRELADGADLVMGNRFRGTIEPAAMPALHRYVGTPALNALAALMAGRAVGDVNCGIRAFRRQAVLDLGLRSTGMELASEMVVGAVRAGLDVRQVPVSLGPDGRNGRRSHLRPMRDGGRHLRTLATSGMRSWTKP